jgi:hypothetical protein
MNFSNILHEVGNAVKWKHNIAAKIEYGVICKIYNTFIGGRMIKYANVFSLSEQRIKKIAVWKLEILTKNEI